MFNENNFTPFYSSFLRLCKANGISPSAAAKKAGISSGAPTAWKNNGSIPKPEQRKLLCQLFGVTDLELMGYEIMDPVPPEQSTRGMSQQEREAFYNGLHVGQRKEKPADQMADGFSKYDLLNDENRAAIDALIDRLLASQPDE